MTRPDHQQPAMLISVLLERVAPLGDRDDAAMDLGAFDEPEAEAALVSIALDPMEDAELVETAAESLGEIWSRNRRIDPRVLERLTGAPAELATSLLDDRWPGWRERLSQA